MSCGLLATLAPWLSSLLVIGGVLVALFFLLVLMIIVPNPIRQLMTMDRPARWGLTYQPVELPDGIAAWRFGKGERKQAILLVHGRSRSKSWMLPMVELLLPRADVLAIDLPAHGQSEFDWCSYGVRESRAVRHAAKWLADEGYNDVAVIGFSMGGAATLIAQGSAPLPAVRGIVTVGTYADIESVLQRSARGMLLPWAFGRILMNVSARLASFDPDQARPARYVPLLTVPYLAIQGDEDELVPVSHAEQLAAAAPAGLARAVYYPGKHDEPANPRLHAEVLAFLNRLEREAIHPVRH